MENEYINKLIETEQRSKSNEKRLDEHARKIEDIHDLTYSVKELAIEVKNMREDINKVDNRLNVLEEQPGKNWDKLKWIVITGIATAILGFVLGKIGL